MADIRKRTGAKGTTYQVRYPSNATKSGFAYATFATLKEARAFTQNLGSLNEVPGAKALTVNEGIDLWLNICEKVGRDGREPIERETLKFYTRHARVMKEYAWRFKLHEIEPAHVVQFRSWLLERRTRGDARRTLSLFHSMLVEMKQQGYLRDDPAAGISIKAGGRYEEAGSKFEIPTDQEMRDILAAADRLATSGGSQGERWQRYRAMIYLAAFSGMRPSEYRGLPWSSIGDGYIDVRQRADAAGIIGPVKSNAGRRRIYVPRFVTEMIENWRPHCPESDLDLVFPTANGKPLTLAHFGSGIWPALLIEAGLDKKPGGNGRVRQPPKYRLYALRHYYASKLIQQGKDLKFIQTMMGHSRIEMTLNIYGHLIKGDEESYRNDVEELARSILPPKTCGNNVASAVHDLETEGV